MPASMTEDMLTATDHDLMDAAMKPRSASGSGADPNAKEADSVRTKSSEAKDSDGSDGATNSSGNNDASKQRQGDEEQQESKDSSAKADDGNANSSNNSKDKPNTLVPKRKVALTTTATATVAGDANAGTTDGNNKNRSNSISSNGKSNDNKTSAVVATTNTNTNTTTVTTTNNSTKMKDMNKDKLRRKKKRKSKRSRSRRRLLFSDSICVYIPLNVTADMRVPLERQRKKRIRRIYQRYPALLEERKRALQRRKEQDGDMDADSDKGKDGVLLPAADDEAQDNDNDADNGNDNANANSKKVTKRKPVLTNVPQPDQFGSVIDYLEAKYTRGVMLNDDEDGMGGTDADNAEADGAAASAPAANQGDGEGSVYSQSSFLDDTDLRRTVAEQVMANATLTKLELEHDDNDFFVNVGNLEVENDEYVRDDYDPLKDENDETKKKKKKQTKKKLPASSTPKNAAAAGDTIDAKSSKKTQTPSQPNGNKNDNAAATAKAKGGKGKGRASLGAQSIKSAKSSKSNATVNSKKKTTKADSADDESADHSAAKEEDPQNDDDDNDGDQEVDDTEEMDETQQQLRQNVEKCDAKRIEMRKQLSAAIKALTDEELPRFKTKLKVTVVCPPDKKSGDYVTFTNPHNPGQKLRVKVPKDCTPGTSFKVTVPAKRPPQTSPTTDLNKFSREFQELLDDYAHAHDDWCVAMGDFDPDFSTYKEKVNKYESFAKLFPKNLLTTVTESYMKRLIRRSRQNRHKRIKAAANRQTQLDETAKSVNVEGADGAGTKDGNVPDLTQSSSDANKEKDGAKPKRARDADGDAPASKRRVRRVELMYPTQGSMFPAIPFQSDDFTIPNGPAPRPVPSTPRSMPSAQSTPASAQRSPKSKASSARKPVKKERSSTPPPRTDVLHFPSSGSTFQKLKFLETHFVRK